MKKWNIKYKSSKRGEGKKSDEEVVGILLKNRGLTTKKKKNEFLKPKSPNKITLEEVGIKSLEIKKAISRVEKAGKSGEGVIVYGDYDADGICATAILWETLDALGVSAMPHIPDRFTEGYGLNSKTIKTLKKENSKLKLIITVDNGIVAKKAVTTAKKLGIDVIISDHHQMDGKAPSATAVVHTTKIGGAAVAWFLAREIRKALKLPDRSMVNGLGLGLAAIGTSSDVMPLLGTNRSIVKFGIEDLRKTKRKGIKAMLEQTARKPEEIGTYDLGYIIGPRINAMGRLAHGIEALRLLCTKNLSRAAELARLVSATNDDRKRVVEEVMIHAHESAKGEWEGAIIIAHEGYHEGVIGLAASELVKKYYRPAIVISKKEKESKASARSIEGFNIIKAIRQFKHLTKGGGGHPMAAGFSIDTDNIKDFIKEFTRYSAGILTKEMLQRSLNVDMELDFGSISSDLVGALKQFDPTGPGNPAPIFATRGVEIVDTRAVGQDKKHLKLILKKNGKEFGAIAFGFGWMAKDIEESNKIDVAYSIFENDWNGRVSVELRVKDIK